MLVSESANGWWGMQGVVAKMQASRGDDQAKAKVFLERAERAEADAAALRAQAVKLSAEQVRCTAPPVCLSAARTGCVIL